MTRYFASLLLCIGLAVMPANADVVHSTDYESDGASQGAGFDIQPSSMGFTDGGGDFAGQVGLGLSTSNPNSGSYSYVIDAGNTADNGNGWGGSWSGVSTVGGANSGGFTDETSAIANGSGSYINYDGATFTASAMVATDSADPLSGSANAAIRLEIYSKVDNDGDGVVDGTTELLPRVIGNLYDASNITADYQQTTASYTITSADAAMGFGIDRVVAVLGTDGLGFNGADGLIHFDDLLFEVSGANVVTVPEPVSASLLLAGFLSLCGLARRKRN